MGLQFGYFFGMGTIVGLTVRCHDTMNVYV